MSNFEETIKPFVWVDHETSVSVVLTARVYKTEIFETRAEEGFEGSGYDWASLAVVFLAEKMPELEEVVQFDPEAGMFCAYSSDSEALKNFALGFKSACEDKALITDLFSRAELD